MAFDIFKTQHLLMAVERLTPPTSFLKDYFFPTNDATDIFTTDDVLVEYKDGSKKVAPFVVPMKNGLAVQREGYVMERYEPPTVAPKRVLTLDELNKKGFGEAIFSTLTPEARAGALVVKDAAELGEMITRREEAMAAEVMRTNACIMNHYADSGELVEEKTIQFYEDANPATYTPATKWDVAEADIYGDLAAMIKMLTSKGLPATDLVVAPDVAELLIADETIQTLLDIRRYELGAIAPELNSAYPGAAVIGIINVLGRNLKIWVYDETYTNESDVDTPYIPAGYAILSAQNAGKTIYGAVTQLEQADGEFHTYAGRRVPKHIADPNNNVRTLTLTAKPICMPVQKNPWVSAKVTT